MSDLRESLTQTGTLIGYINSIVYAHNYNDLTNKPQINGVTLQGNKTASELGLVTPATEAVQSVNGETGVVVLDGNDIAYDNNNTINQQIDAVAASIDYPVTSVNEQTGDVVLDGMDIAYDSSYTINQKIDAVESSIPVVDYPVTSVNEQTGDVVLDGDDIAYNSSLSVNQKIDAVEAAIPVVDYPVTSVAGRTGDVVLYAADIMAQETASGAIATFKTSLEKTLVNCTTESGASKIINVSGNVSNLATYIRGIYQGNYGFVNLGDLSYQRYEAGGVYYFRSYNLTDLKPATAPNAANILAYGYETKTSSTMVDKSISVANGQKILYMRDDTYTSEAALQAALDGVYLIYELETAATPAITQADLTVICNSFGVYGIAYDLPLATNPITYNGYNNIFTDNGDISVAYLETVQDYIDSH